MAKITNFNKGNLKTLRAELDSALAGVLAKHGLTADLGNIRFSNTDFRCKLEVSVSNSGEAPGSEADTNAINERKFKAHAWKFGLTGDEFGKKFISRGTEFTIIEINPRAKRGGYPVIAKNARGTTYKFSAQNAVNAI